MIVIITIVNVCYSHANAILQWFTQDF